MRSDYHHGDLPSTLRAIVTEVVRRKGAAAVSLRAVSREAGVDIAAVYRHYRSKSDLLHAVADDGFQAMAERMHTELEGVDDPEERLVAVGAGYVGFAIDEPGWFALMFGTLAQREGRPPGGPRLLLREAIGALHDAGRLTRPADEAADVAWASVHGLARLHLDGLLSDAATRQRLRPLLRTVLRGLTGG